MQTTLTRKVLCSFFDKWNQDEAHERVAYAVIIDYEFDFLH